MATAAVAFNIGLAKYKSAGDELKNLHRLCYGRAGKVRHCQIARLRVALPDMLVLVQKTEVKGNLRKFTGFADVSLCSVGCPFDTGGLSYPGRVAAGGC